MPTYRADLSVSSLDELLRNVKSYQAKVNAAPERIVSELARIATNSISETISGITDSDGNATGSVGSNISGNTAMVFNEGDQVGYIEFGTGVTGAAEPHPQARKSGWSYDKGSKIFTTKSGKRMWRYYDTLKGHWRITSGLPAQKQVYKAALKMRDNIVQVAKEALK